MLSKNTLMWQKPSQPNLYHSLKMYLLEIEGRIGASILSNKICLESESFINESIGLVESVDKIVAKDKSNHTIRLEMSLEKMNALLAHKQICAEDIRCLDPNSKQSFMKLCLNTCLSKPCKSSSLISFL
ncbi:MAG: hypothetical protein methR_P0865 [Methyloprofundus sp.]|nr:MAG: hypothetical protein methR_P0865 [Methyloprofundus sp.]